MKIVLFVGGFVLAGVILGGLTAYSSFERVTFENVTPAPGGPTDPRYPPLPPADGPQPVAYTEKVEFDFGEMKKGDTGSCDFQITNRGSYDLELKQGPTSCKCTLSGLDKATLAPGESTDVRLTWDVKTQLSMFTQTAQVFTNDRTNRTIVFKVTGKVIEPFPGVPAEVTFSKATTEQSHLRAIPLVSKKLDDLKILDYHFDDPETADYFKLLIEPATDGLLSLLRCKSGLMVTVVVEPGLPVGPVTQELVLHTNSEDEPEVVIPYHGIIRGDISVAGPGWDDESDGVKGVSGIWRFVGRLSGKKGSTQKLVILLRGPHRKEVDLKVTSVKPSFLKVDLGEPKDIGNNLVDRVQLTAEIPPGTPPGNFTGGPVGEKAEIVIETGVPQPSEIRLHPIFLLEE